MRTRSVMATLAVTGLVVLAPGLAVAAPAYAVPAAAGQHAPAGQSAGGTVLAGQPVAGAVLARQPVAKTVPAGESTGVTLLAEADSSPKPTVNRAGTSFLNATPISPDQPVQVAAATGDYLYWSFTASAGKVYDVAITVKLPDQNGRHGAQAWIVEAFDGLRRRQACVAGAQSPVGAASDAQVSPRCTLRQIRSWAEPWSGDPLPGTYYLRLSATELPEQDLGQQVDVDLSLTARDGDVSADDGELAAALTPVTKAGTVSAASAAGAGGTAAEETDTDDDSFLPDLPSLSARWFWTAGGGVLAALAAVVGFALTRRSGRPGPN